MPDEVAEEDNDEIVVGSDEAAEETDVLGREGGTTIANMTISMRWLA